MKTAIRNYLIIAGLFVAVFVLVVAKNLTTQKQMEALADDSVIGGGRPVLLELGSDSCIPCKQMAPVLAELDVEQDTFVVSFVDVWKATEKGKEYGISAIPTQIFFDGEGKELFRHTGFYPKEDILAKWNELGIYVKPTQND
jgi:thiol-disulfide isomerase/thioredoxin